MTKERKNSADQHRMHHVKTEVQQMKAARLAKEELEVAAIVEATASEAEADSCRSNRAVEEETAWQTTQKLTPEKGAVLATVGSRPILHLQHMSGVRHQLPDYQ